MKAFLIALFLMNSAYALENGVKTFKYPYTAQVRIAGFCSATHLGRGFFLTAGHCIYKIRGGQVSVKSRLAPGKPLKVRTYIGKRKSSSYTIKSIYVHNSYKKSVRKERDMEKASLKALDLAIVVVEEEPNIPAATLSFGTPAIDDYVTVAGSGLDENNNSGSLKIGISYILSRYKHPTNKYYSFFISRERSKLNRGDSGGGVYIGNSVVGVNSAKLPSLKKDMIYSINHAKGWINEILATKN
jgi:hypothetical protein